MKARLGCHSHAATYALQAPESPVQRRSESALPSLYPASLRMRLSSPLASWPGTVPQSRPGRP